MNIMVNSTYSDILDKFGVTRYTFSQTLNLLFAPLKCNYMKHMWDLIDIVDVENEIVREVIRPLKIKLIVT